MLQSVVIDASYVLAFLLPDERVSEVDVIFDQYASGSIRLTAPVLLPFEVLNAIKSAILQKRLTDKAGHQLVTAFLDLTIPLEDVNLEEAYLLSLKRKVSVYDAAYLYLASTIGSPLLTLDKRLSKVN